VGGAEVLGLADVCGNFEVGKQFDALLVDCSVGPIDLWGGESSIEKVPRLPKPHTNFLDLFVPLHMC
jgi:hypothetical protein